MSTVKGKVVAAKGWLTRASNRLAEDVAAKVDDVALRESVSHFEDKLRKFDNAQEHYELSIADEDELLKAVNSAGEFREGCMVNSVKAKSELEKRGLAIDKGASKSKVVPGSAKLPKLELPKFGGDVLEWLNFWDQFSAVVDTKSDLPAVSKFTYLQSLLYGEAKTVICGLSTTEKNYPIACKLLAERYSRKDRIIFAHIQALLNVTVPDNCKPAELWKLQDTLLGHVRSLETLDISGRQYGVLLTPMILSRLPEDIRIEWARQRAGRESDLNGLLTFLQEEIQTRERSETYAQSSTDTVKPGSVVSLQTVSKKPPEVKKQVSCGVCRKKHATHNCWGLTNINVSERKAKIKSANLCFRCLKGDHMARSCEAVCAKCKGRHHILLCGGKTVTQNASTVDACSSNVTSGVIHGGRSTNTVPSSPANTVQGPVTPSSNDARTVSYQNQTAQYLTHDQSPPLEGSTLLNSTSGGTVLQTVRVFVRGKKGVVRATALLDTGSDRSYITSSLAAKVGLEAISTELVRYQSFGSGSVCGNGMSRVYDVQLEGVQGGLHNLRVAEVPVICTPMCRQGVPSDLSSAFGPLRFADNYTENRQVTVDLLIGLDYYWKSGVIRIPGLVAQETVFGWVVSGSWSTVKTDAATTCLSLCCLTDIPEASLRNLWDLESVGILPTTSEMSESDELVLEKFNQTIRYSEEEQRYEVCVPWNENPGPSQLLNNEGIAKGRLRVLDKYLDRNLVLKDGYDGYFRDMEESSIITDAGDNPNNYPVYYLPHRPVIREASVSTKIRPVFDASCKGYNGISLNDCVHSGPSLLPNLTEILLRFRRWQIGLSADIIKAFLQIKLNPRDQEVHRFFLKCGDEVRTMKFLRVPFGNKSSPFLLNATVKYHLSRSPPSVAVPELRDNMYVDDWLSGEDTDDKVCALFKDGEKVMNRAGMSFAKCSSNSETVSEMFLKEFESKHLDTDSVKVLGLKWMKIVDCFRFDGVDVPPSLQITKRTVLSFVARLFDPLGFLNPYIMMIKVLFQKLWKLGLGWDEELPVELAMQFRDWLEGLTVIKNWEIPRCYFPGTQWNTLEGLEVHVFCDAADQKGYGACVYLRLPSCDGSYRVSFVVSKARVAPVRPITLPRLELLGALLGARLLSFVVRALKLSDQVVYKCWTDSTIVLSWIKGDASQWKVFVANRVREICRLTDPTCWYHCPGESNPADLVTRGISASKLVSSSLWLKGPEWLSHSDIETVLVTSVGLDMSICEDEKLDVSLVSVDCAYECPFSFERWSSFDKTVRIVAYVLRCISNLKVQKSMRLTGGDFNQTELDSAVKTVFSCVQKIAYPVELAALEKNKKIPRTSSILQLSPFLDDGLLRVNTRLKFSELAYEEKYPLLLPCCHVTLLLVRQHHRNFGHPGVSTLMSMIRGKYWIVCLRRLAKRVKRECVPNCKRLDAKPCGQPIPPLPRLRVTRAPVFTVIGIDFAGPVYAREHPDRKLYILLFTCAVVRAVHLELTDSLSLPDFMLALRRFVARRGLPSAIFSDNAKTFIAASDRLRAALGPNCPKFIRINPISPWWGGWWERLVGSVKVGLKKSVGKASLSRKELETTLIEAEACINSRPLTTVGDSTDSLTPLTPSHF